MKVQPFALWELYVYLIQAGSVCKANDCYCHISNLRSAVLRSDGSYLESCSASICSKRSGELCNSLHASGNLISYVVACKNLNVKYLL